MIKNIAFIPSKTKSLRVPRKNYKLLNDKMLIDYTIELAAECDLIDSIVISSNEKILSNVKSEKIEYHIREGAEADPNISVIELLNLWKKNTANNVNLILLQPTHPFRKKIDLRNSLKFFQDNLALDSLVSITNQKVRHIKTDRNIICYDEEIIHSNKFINGQIYIFRLFKNRKISFGENTFLYEITASEYNINIDEPHDFRLATLLAKNFTSS